MITDVQKREYVRELMQKAFEATVNKDPDIISLYFISLVGSLDFTEAMELLLTVIYNLADHITREEKP